MTGCEVRQIATVGLDDLVQMSAAILPNRESVHGLVRVGEELTQLAAIGALARELLGVAKIAGRRGSMVMASSRRF